MGYVVRPRSHCVAIRMINGDVSISVTTLSSVFKGDGRHRCRDQQPDPFPSTRARAAPWTSPSWAAAPEPGPKARPGSGRRGGTAPRPRSSPRRRPTSPILHVVDGIDHGQLGGTIRPAWEPHDHPNGGAAPTASPLAHYPDDTPHHGTLPTP